jgi:hypothetical protein
MQHSEAAAYHHYYTGLEEIREKALSAFNQAYQGFPSVFSNCLIYSCPAGQHIGKAAEANLLIKQLGLPLAARPTALAAQNSFTVQFAMHDESVHGG